MPVPSPETPERRARREKARRQIGARLRELRIERGLTQAAVALEAGLSRNMVIWLETGQRSIAHERLWDLADALSVPIEELFREPSSESEGEIYKGGTRPSNYSAGHVKRKTDKN